MSEQAVVAGIEVEEEQAPRTLSWGEAASLAVPQGLAVVLSAAAVLLWVLAYSYPALFLGGLACVVVAHGLLRLRPWARYWSWLLGAVLLDVGLLSATEVPLSLTLVPTGLLLLALLSPGCKRWFEEGSEAAFRSASLRPYFAAVVWGVVLLVVFAFMVPAAAMTYWNLPVFRTGLPAQTEGVLSVARAVPYFWFLWFPVLVLGPFALLRVPAHFEKTAFLGVNLAGVVALGSISAWLYLPHLL